MVFCLNYYPTFRIKSPPNPSEGGEGLQMRDLPSKRVGAYSLYVTTRAVEGAGADGVSLINTLVGINAQVLRTISV